MPDFLLPDLGEGLTEAEVVAWHVTVGDTVAVDQVVAEVETAKAVVDVPVPFAGVVVALHARPGTTVAVGSPLVSVTEAGSAAGFHEPGVVTADADGPGEEGSGNVLIGYGTSTPRRRRRPGRRPAPDGAAAPEGARPVAPATSADVSLGVASGGASAVDTGGTLEPGGTLDPGGTPATGGTSGAGAAVPAGPARVISPVVRKLARHAGVDLHRVDGTGPGGLVRRADVERVIVSRAEPVLPPSEAAPVSSAEAPVDLSADEATRIPLRGVRRAVADKLSRSRREIPEATVWVDVDATGLLAARELLTGRMPERPVGVLALLARFTVLALRRYPELNARVEQDEIVVLERVHLGFAAQTDRGLVVPVVRNAQGLSTRDLGAALAQRTAAARAGSLTPADLTGGTITVNNYGVFGVDGSAAIINYPEAAIVGMGRIIDRPWVVDGRLEVRKVTQLTLAFDHRVCDGGTAGGFLRYIADCVESPLVALGDL